MVIHKAAPTHVQRDLTLIQFSHKCAGAEAQILNVLVSADPPDHLSGLAAASSAVSE